jgi:guanylate kinase
MSNVKLEKQGCVMVISGPSGSGKSSIAQKILTAEKNLIQSVSYTTRKPRDGEIDGVNYHFIDQSDFSTMVITGQLLEFTEIHGNYYGTPKKVLDDIVSSGKDVLFDIEANGAKAIKSKLGSNCFTIFILPPSIEELSLRLQSRAKDSQINIIQRIKNAKSEIERMKEYDYVIVNSDLAIAAAHVRTILFAERNKRNRITNIDEFIGSF